MEKIILIGDRLLVEIVVPGKEGSLHLPASFSAAMTDLLRYFVRGKGKGEVSDQLEIGDEIRVDVNRMQKVMLNGKELTIMDAHGALAIKRTDVELEN